MSSRVGMAMLSTLAAGLFKKRLISQMSVLSERLDITFFFLGETLSYVFGGCTFDRKSMLVRPASVSSVICQYIIFISITYNAHIKFIQKHNQFSSINSNYRKNKQYALSSFANCALLIINNENRSTHQGTLSATLSTTPAYHRLAHRSCTHLPPLNQRHPSLSWCLLGQKRRR